MSSGLSISVLTDNNAKRDSHLLAEHGLSIYIECDDLKLLFDTGDTDVYLKNAAKMKINLQMVDLIALSHHHYDHVGGVKYFPLQNRKIKLLAQKYAFYPRLGYSNDLSTDKIIKKFNIISIDTEPFELTPNLIFLGSIPCSNNFEKRKNFGKVMLPSGEFTDDFVEDDSALIYRSSEGIIIITGCSHSGICNITQHAITIAEKKWGISKVKTIVGGFHLIKSNHDLLNKTTDFLRSKEIRDIYPCHCTDLNAKIALDRGGLSVQEIGTGTILNF